MELAHRRHDITDMIWSILEPHLSGKKGDWGGIAVDNRLFINAVFWILRTGAPWRDLPPDYGDWKNTHRRFSRWRDKGAWEKLLELLIDDVDYEWLMIDSTHVKVHQHAAGAIGGNQSMSVSKGGSTPRYIRPWMRMVCRSELLLRKVPQLIVLRLRSL
jgi:transposase